MSENNKTKNIYTAGTKLYKFIDNNCFMVRVIKFRDNYYMVRIIKGDDYIVGSKMSISYDDLHNNYIKLNEDGIISFNILKGEKKDVMICLHKKEELSNTIPFAICRQDVVDIFTMYTNTPPKGQIWCGISVNAKNCPAEMKMEDFMLCEDVLETRFIAVYLDDTLDDILDCIYLGKYNTILENLYKYRQGTNIIGNCKSVKELMENHNFMSDFHEAFGVTEVPFLINNDNKFLIMDVISQMLQKVVSNVYIIPYSKEINTKEFERDYVLMTPDWSKCKNEDKSIFIIGYDVNEDEDYLTSKYGTNNKEELIKQLGFNIM